MNIVSLLDGLVKGILAAEETFFENPRDFHALETNVKASTESFATGFLSVVLSGLDKAIRDSGWRDGKYTVHRMAKRTIISSVGDITFDCTYYRGVGERSGFTSLVEGIIGLTRNEKFTEAARIRPTHGSIENKLSGSGESPSFKTGNHEDHGYKQGSRHCGRDT